MKPITLILLALVLSGCSDVHSPSIDERVKTLESSMPEFPTPNIWHLKESNYRIGISSEVPVLRDNRNGIMEIRLKDGRWFYIEDVKEAVQ